MREKGACGSYLFALRTLEGVKWLKRSRRKHRIDLSSASTSEFICSESNRDQRNAGRENKSLCPKPKMLTMELLTEKAQEQRPVGGTR